MMHLLSVPSPYGWLWSAGQKNPLPQESEASAAEHLALEHLDPVDVSFDDAGVPGQGEPGDDGVAVTFDTCGEGMDYLRELRWAACSRIRRRGGTKTFTEPRLYAAVVAASSSKERSPKRNRFYRLAGTRARAKEPTLTSRPSTQLKA